MDELKEILLHASNLRNLDIGFTYYWLNRNVANPRLLQLPLHASDQLPPLHELTLSGPPETYEFDVEHCRMLSQCMDWSQLRRLDLGISCPEHIFNEMGGRLHSLRSLSIGVRTGERLLSTWLSGRLTCRSVDSVTRFIRSVPGLHELIVTDLNPSAPEIAEAILGSQKSLQLLAYRVCPAYRRRQEGCSYAWTTTQLHELRQSCRDLSHLEIDFPLTKRALVNEPLPTWIIRT